MTKETYLSIRNKMDFRQQASKIAIHFLQDLVLLGAMILTWNFFLGSYFRILIAPLLAIFMYRKFGLLHEAVHGTIFTSRFWNDVVGILSSPFCFLPYEPWRLSHIEHHYWSGNIEKDPVMAILVVYPALSSRVKTVFNFFWRSGLPILGFCQHGVFLMISIKAFLKNPKSIKIGLSLLWPMTIWMATLYFGSREFLNLVVAPTLLLYLMGVEVLNLPHHLQLQQHHDGTKFPLWEQHQTARSCIYPKWIARFVVLNFNYHVEHHMFPDAPWYYLDELQAIVSQDLQQNYNYDHYFSWILRAKRQSLDQVLLDPKYSKKGSLVAEAS